MKVIEFIITSLIVCVLLLSTSSDAYAQRSCASLERKFARLEAQVERTREKQNKVVDDATRKEARYREKERAYLDAASELTAACQAGNQRACSRQQRLYRAVEKIYEKIDRLWIKVQEKWEKYDQKIARLYERLSEVDQQLQQCRQGQ